MLNQQGDVRIFMKSGNRVRLLELVATANPPAWRVERVEGVSAGKTMICNERSLIREDLLGCENE